MRAHERSGRGSRGKLKSAPLWRFAFLLAHELGQPDPRVILQLPPWVFLGWLAHFRLANAPEEEEEEPTVLLETDEEIQAELARWSGGDNPRS